MKKLGYVYQVHVRLELSEEEVEAAIYCSENHYDERCRSASRPGSEGFLNGIRNYLWVQNQISPTRSVETFLLISELDLLTKILEPWSPPHAQHRVAESLYYQCAVELRAANKVQRRMNREDETT